MPQPDQQLDSRTRVVTPENIAFEYRTAGPFTRLGAYLIDIGIQLLVVILSIFAFMLMAIALFSAVFSGSFSLWSVVGNLGTFTIFLLWFLMQWFYGAYFEYRWNGQTPGKRMLGLRVLQTDGRPITFTQAILRNLVRWLDARPALPLGAELVAVLAYIAPVALGSHLVGFASAALTRRHQRLGDLVCGTMVVAEDRSFVGAMDTIEEPAIAELAETLPATFVPSRSLSKAITHYIGRRKYFGPARRQEIARHVGVVLIDRLDLPADTDCDLLLCALYLRSFGAEEEPMEAVLLPDDQSPPASTPASTTPAAVTTDDQPTDWESVPLG
ncbi:MAG: RDD family protein [Planctomycetota bacterium]